MSFIDTIKEFLGKPFPQEESFISSLKIVSAISIFVVLFLYIFKPFGLHQMASGLFILCLGFGLVAFITSLIYELIVVKVLRIKGQGTEFNFGTWILYFLGAVLVISFTNFLYVRLVLFGDIQWNLYPYMLRGTFAIGAFPAIVIGAIAVFIQERKYQGIAHQFNHSEKRSSSLSIDADASLFNIPIHRIRYIEAMQNYIKLQHLNDQGEIVEHVERATLKGISSEGKGESVGGSLIRCHRSFFVNQNYISSSSGNAQGLLLDLSDCQQKIPVSRSYVAKFKTRQQHST